MRDIEFQNGDFVHIFNRGAYKLPIFRDQADFKRFRDSLFLFNDATFKNPRGNTELRDDILLRCKTEPFHERVPFVQILSYNLMDNHFHLFVKQLLPNGIPTFMHKLGMGYSKYVSRRHGHSGTMFEGPYKAVLCQFDEHRNHLPRYIHLNSLDRTEMDWRNGTIQDWNKVIEVLDENKWSSHSIYMGGHDELPVVDESAVQELFPTTESYLNYIKAWTGRRTISEDGVNLADNV